VWQNRRVRNVMRVINESNLPHIDRIKPATTTIVLKICTYRTCCQGCSPATYIEIRAKDKRKRQTVKKEDREVKTELSLDPRDLRRALLRNTVWAATACSRFLWRMNNRLSLSLSLARSRARAHTHTHGWYARVRAAMSCQRSRAQTHVCTYTWRSCNSATLCKLPAWPSRPSRWTYRLACQLIYRSRARCVIVNTRGPPVSCHFIRRSQQHTIFVVVGDRRLSSVESAEIRSLPLYSFVYAMQSTPVDGDMLRLVGKADPNELEKRKFNCTTDAISIKSDHE